MISTAARHAVFNARQAVLRPVDVREYREMRTLDAASPEFLVQLQQNRILSMARHAFTTSPFYRDRYTRAGLDLRDLADPQVLPALPIVDKADLRSEFDRVRSRSAALRDVTERVTGGSTGEPLRVLYDRRVGEHSIGWRMRDWWGIHPSDPRAKVWRAGPRAGSRRRTIRHALSWPSVRITMNASHLEEADLVAFLGDWNRFRPRLVMGYVGALLEVARFVRDTGRHMAPAAAVEATAAPVTEAQKTLLSEAFGAPVYDVYQSNEAPVMAGECDQRDGLHVFSDTRWIELVDDAGRPVAPGQPGTVLVTDLRNRAFPLIRYRQGDVTSWKLDGCRCGRPYPVLNPVRGRATDNLHLPSGTVVTGDAMTALFDDWPRAVRQFQLVQHVDRSLTLRCVPGEDPRADGIMREVAAGLERTVGGEVPVRLEVVDAIPHDRGKTRFIVREDAAAVPAQGRPAVAQSTGTSRTSPLSTS